MDNFLCEVEHIEHLLGQDPISKAEKITGAKLGDSATDALAFALTQQRRSQLKKSLEKAGDTHMGMSFSAFYTSVLANGFQSVLEIPFKNDQYKDHLSILWNPLGVILKMDSFTGQINSAEMFYNWVPKASTTTVYVGPHDVRDGLRYSLYLLQKSGTFQCPWTVKPKLTLNHHQEAQALSSEAYASFQDARLKEIPQNIRVLIDVG